MTRTYGSQSMVGELQTVLVRRPDQAFGDADPQPWHYTARPNLAVAQAEHDALVGTLQAAGCEVVYHEIPMPHHADAIYVYDPVLVTDRGAILLQMGKPLRNGEEAALGEMLQRLGVPILARLHGSARAEGGDMLWLDEKTLAIGVGFRTNEEGVRQVREALAAGGVEVIRFDLPYFQGPEACLHLLSFISIVDHDLAVIYEPFMPVRLWQLLKDRGFRFVHVPEAEWPTMGPNVLAVAPGKCVLLADNVVTKQRLEAAGCTVFTYVGNEISHKAEGGATCLTRPILRLYRRSS